jgi:hypothetical protein
LRDRRRMKCERHPGSYQRRSINKSILTLRGKSSGPPAAAILFWRGGGNQFLGVLEKNLTTKDTKNVEQFCSTKIELV